jgi:predicted negative regulator of RcsB-dependent stress response
MDYYGISALITILVTSITAFYLLYKLKELNLGIVISVSGGSIILGFSFYPAFNTFLRLLDNNSNIDKKLMLIISILAILLIFLITILIISIIITIAIPKRIVAIDCCIIIDDIKGKIQLKKSFDTSQIIDTMGVEKGENLPLADNEAIDEDTQNIVSTYDGLVIAAYEETVYTDVSETDESELSGFDNPIEAIDTAMQEASVIIEKDTADKAEDTLDTGCITAEFINADDDTASGDTETAGQQIAELSGIETVEEASEEIPLAATQNNNNIFGENNLVLKAFESKASGRREEAIKYYTKALQTEKNSEMLFWIVLDICALYKQLGLNDLAGIILDGIVSEYGAIIKPGIKAEIMNNLK